MLIVKVIPILHKNGQGDGRGIDVAIVVDHRRHFIDLKPWMTFTAQIP